MVILSFTFLASPFYTDLKLDIVFSIVYVMVQLFDWQFGSILYKGGPAGVFNCLSCRKLGECI